MNKYKFSDSNGKRFVVFAKSLQEAEKQVISKSVAKTVYFQA